MWSWEDEHIEYANHLEEVHRVSAEQANVGASLAGVAVSVGRRIAQSLRVNISSPEVASTRDVLIGLMDAIPNLVVQDIGGTRQEAITGADWEWWIEGERQWFRMLVQAKQLSNDLNHYSLGATVGKNGPLQVDRLLSASIGRGIPAIYALYNPSLANLDYVSDNCFAYTEGKCLPVGAEGITLLSASVAKQLLHRNAKGYSVKVPLAEVSPEAVPWSCMVGCWAQCDVDLPAKEAGMELRPLSHELWEGLGLLGSYNPRDPAFRTASVVYGLEARRVDSTEQVTTALGRVREGLVTVPPPYVLEPNSEALRRAFPPDALDQVGQPAHLVVQRRSRRRGQRSNY